MITMTFEQRGERKRRTYPIVFIHILIFTKQIFNKGARHALQCRVWRAAQLLGLCRGPDWFTVCQTDEPVRGTLCYWPWPHQPGVRKITAFSWEQHLCPVRHLAKHRLGHMFCLPERHMKLSKTTHKFWPVLDLCSITWKPVSVNCGGWWLYCIMNDIKCNVNTNQYIFGELVTLTETLKPACRNSSP